MAEENNKMEGKKEEKIKEEIAEEVKEELEKNIPSSPETKTPEKKEEAAEKVGEEVAEEVKATVEKIAKEDKKVEAKKDEKKKSKKGEKVVKKEEAVAKGANLHISKKQSVYICSFIKNKRIDDAISNLEEVKKIKKAIPFKGEIPHRKGKGMMSGRYPVKGAGLFINLLKGLKGNAIINGMDLEITRIVYSSASWGRRPMKSDRRKSKRTNVILKAREISVKAIGEKK